MNEVAIYDRIAEYDRQYRERVKKCGERISRNYKTRFSVLKRDGFRCQYCGADPKKDESVILHVDHIIPKSKGGGDEMENLVTSCFKCNIGKSNNLLEE